MIFLSIKFLKSRILIIKHNQNLKRFKSKKSKRRKTNKTCNNQVFTYNSKISKLKIKRYNHTLAQVKNRKLLKNKKELLTKKIKAVKQRLEDSRNVKKL